jgi:hypothetical protein
MLPCVVMSTPVSLAMEDEHGVPEAGAVPPSPVGASNRRAVATPRTTRMADWVHDEPDKVARGT